MNVENTKYLKALFVLADKTLINRFYHIMNLNSNDHIDNIADLLSEERTEYACRFFEYCLLKMLDKPLFEEIEL